MSELIREKAYKFPLRIVRVGEYLNNEKREFVLSRKLLDSGVNISLFIEEGRQGDDRSEFILKYSVANKEAFKSNILLRILRDTDFITEGEAG